MADDEWHTVSNKSAQHHGSSKQQRRKSKQTSALEQEAAASNTTPTSSTPAHSNAMEQSNPYHLPEDDSEDSEDEEEDQTYSPTTQHTIIIYCPFEPCSLNVPITNTTTMAQHLRDEHRLIFKDLHHMYMSLDAYLSRWAKEFGKKPLEEHGSKDANNDNVYVISAEKNSLDKSIREELQRNKLNEVLVIQQKERDSESKKPRKCLFCKIVCDSRYILFKHMFAEHNFNIGLPDNLVHANEFLNILESKLTSLQCLYCQKTFTSAAVLRKHMRKKKHFKIASRNRQYDRFYIINYIEPGKNWETLEQEKYDSDGDKRDESWEDWQEVEPEPTMCLFDEVVLPSPKEALAHMKNEHRFDFASLREEKDLDFYKAIILINYIRHESAFNRCFSCGETVSDISLLKDHLAEKRCVEAFVRPDADFWKDPRYLLPYYENDPLLTGFEETDDIDLENLRLSNPEDQAENSLSPV